MAARACAARPTLARAHGQTRAAHQERGQPRGCAQVRLWDVAQGRLLQEYSDYKDGVTAVAWLPCGRRFVSSSLDKCAPACV